MNEILIIKKLMKGKRISGAVLAEMPGYNTPSGVTNRLQSKTMTVELLVELLNALDCELIIRNKTGNQESFVITNDDRQSVKNYNRKVTK